MELAWEAVVAGVAGSCGDVNLCAQVCVCARMWVSESVCEKGMTIPVSKGVCACVCVCSWLIGEIVAEHFLNLAGDPSSVQHHFVHDHSGNEVN